MALLAVPICSNNATCVLRSLRVSYLRPDPRIQMCRSALEVHIEVSVQRHVYGCRAMHMHSSPAQMCYNQRVSRLS